jgi:hypothetical protein
MADDINTPLIPVEQLPITLFDSVVLAVRRDDGMIFVSIRDLCLALVINPDSQLRRLRNSPLLSSGLARFRVKTAGGPQATDFLRLTEVPAWLMQINRSRAQDRLIWLQRYLVDTVYQAFVELAGLPGGPSSAIEDLADLQRLDTAIKALADRQGSVESRQASLEQSQQQTHQAWQSLRDEIKAVVSRVSALEATKSGMISREQKSHIYQLVQTWGAARAARETQLSKGAVFAACWSAIKARYKVTKYEELPAEKYHDCITFIRAEYRKVTGTELDIPEQGMLNLE